MGQPNRAGWTTAEVNWDQPSAIDWGRLDRDVAAHWEDLAAPETARRRCARCEAAAAAGTPLSDPTARPQHWLLVEGFLTLWHQPLRARADIAVFVDCPKEVCGARRARRAFEGVHGTPASAAAVTQSAAMPLTPA